MASPLEMTEMYDDTFFGILQNVGNIEDLIQIYFGFLYRKTDFYHLSSSPDDRVGFLPGVAEKIVLTSFKLFERIAEQDRERQLREEETVGLREETRDVPPEVPELEVEQQEGTLEQIAVDAQTEANSTLCAMESSNSASGPLLSSSDPLQPSVECAPNSDPLQPSVECAPNSDPLQPLVECAPNSDPLQPLVECAQKQEETLEPTAADAQTETNSTSGAIETSNSASGPLLPSNDPVQSPQGDQTTATSTNTAEACQQKFQSNPESSDGALRDNYRWSQDRSDVEVCVYVPKTATKGRQVKVNLENSSVHVSLTEGTHEKVILQGEFTHRVNAENSTCKFEPGRRVVLSLSKWENIWWKTLLKGEPEPEIEINCERPLASVDEEAIAALDGLRLNNDQKLHELDT